MEIARFAGLLYPQEEEVLERAVDMLLDAASPVDDAPDGALKALVVPFAELGMMGPVAAPAYALLREQADHIERVVVVGSAQRIPFRGVALSSVEVWRTPLGDIPVDQDMQEHVARTFAPHERIEVRYIDGVHDAETSLEVQLPFLQSAMKGTSYQVVPMLMGDGGVEDLGPVLEALWGERETLVIIATELATGVDIEAARRLDVEAKEAIVRLDPEAITRDHASARVPLRALLALASRDGLEPQSLLVRRADEIMTGEDRHVSSREEKLTTGFGAFAFFEPEKEGAESGPLS